MSARRSSGDRTHVLHRTNYPHPVLDRLHGIITAVFVLLVILASSLCVNVAQVVVWCLVFVPSYHRLTAAQTLSNTWWLLLAYGVEVWSAIPYHITGDLPRTNDIAMLLGNHAPGIDFITGIIIASLPHGPGTGHMMTLMKASLRWMPTIGFTHYLQGSLFLARNWDKDQRPINAKLDAMNSGLFPRPFWIGLYPEGTRITAEKRVASHAFAKERDLPMLDYVLLPRTKGFTYLVDRLGDTLTAIYDATCAYSHSALHLSHPIIYGRFLCDGAFIHIKRTDAKQVRAMPVMEQESWLVAQWQRKDNLLKSFDEHKKFVIDSASSAKPFPIDRSRYYHLTGMFVAWALIASVFVSLLTKSWPMLIASIAMIVVTLLRSVMLDGERLFGITLVGAQSHPKRR